MKFYLINIKIFEATCIEFKFTHTFHSLYYSQIIHVNNYNKNSPKTANCRNPLTNADCKTQYSQY